MFLQSVRTVQGAQSRLDDYLDSAVRDVIGKNKLVEAVRLTNRVVDLVTIDDQQQEVAGLFMANLAENLRAGVELKSDSNLAGGFRVAMVDENVEHDFSDEAIADALGQLVRPVLADILKKAVAKG